MANIKFKFIDEDSNSIYYIKYTCDGKSDEIYELVNNKDGVSIIIDSNNVTITFPADLFKCYATDTLMKEGCYILGKKCDIKNNENNFIPPRDDIDYFIESKTCYVDPCSEMSIKITEEPKIHYQDAEYNEIDKYVTNIIVTSTNPNLTLGNENMIKNFNAMEGHDNEFTHNYATKDHVNLDVSLLRIGPNPDSTYYYNITITILASSLINQNFPNVNQYYLGDKFTMPDLFKDDIYLVDKTKYGYNYSTSQACFLYKFKCYTNTCGKLKLGFLNTGNTPIINFNEFIINNQIIDLYIDPRYKRIFYISYYSCCDDVYFKITRDDKPGFEPFQQKIQNNVPITFEDITELLENDKPHYKVEFISKNCSCTISLRGIISSSPVLCECDSQFACKEFNLEKYPIKVSSPYINQTYGSPNKNNTCLCISKRVNGETTGDISNCPITLTFKDGTSEVMDCCDDTNIPDPPEPKDCDCNIVKVENENTYIGGKLCANAYLIDSDFPITILANAYEETISKSEAQSMLKDSGFDRYCICGPEYYIDINNNKIANCNFIIRSNQGWEKTYGNCCSDIPKCECAVKKDSQGFLISGNYCRNFSIDEIQTHGSASIKIYKDEAKTDLYQTKHISLSDFVDVDYVCICMDSYYTVINTKEERYALCNGIIEYSDGTINSFNCCNIIDTPPPPPPPPPPPVPPIDCECNILRELNGGFYISGTLCHSVSIPDNQFPINVKSEGYERLITLEDATTMILDAETSTYCICAPEYHVDIANSKIANCDFVITFKDGNKIQYESCCTPKDIIEVPPNPPGPPTKPPASPPCLCDIKVDDNNYYISGNLCVTIKRDELLNGDVIIRSYADEIKKEILEIKYSKMSDFLDPNFLDVKERCYCLTPYKLDKDNNKLPVCYIEMQLPDGTIRKSVCCDKLPEPETPPSCDCNIILDKNINYVSGLSSIILDKSKVSTKGVAIRIYNNNKKIKLLDTIQIKLADFNNTYINEKGKEVQCFPLPSSFDILPNVKTAGCFLEVSYYYDDKPRVKEEFSCCDSSNILDNPNCEPSLNIDNLIIKRKYNEDSYFDFGIISRYENINNIDNDAFVFIKNIPSLDSKANIYDNTLVNESIHYFDINKNDSTTIPLILLIDNLIINCCQYTEEEIGNIEVSVSLDDPNFMFSYYDKTTQKVVRGKTFSGPLRYVLRNNIVNFILDIYYAPDPNKLPVFYQNTGCNGNSSNTIHEEIKIVNLKIEIADIPANDKILFCGNFSTIIPFKVKIRDSYNNDPFFYLTDMGGRVTTNLEIIDGRNLNYNPNEFKGYLQLAIPNYDPNVDYTGYFHKVGNLYQEGIVDYVESNKLQDNRFRNNAILQFIRDYNYVNIIDYNYIKSLPYNVGKSIPCMKIPVIIASNMKYGMPYHKVYPLYVQCSLLTNCVMTLTT